MKEITIQRPYENFNKYCSYEVFVGKEKLTELKNGEEKIVELSKELENEILKAKIQWCGSNIFPLKDFSPDGIIKVSGNKFLNLKIPFIGSVFPIILIGIINASNQQIKYIGSGLIIFLIFFLLGTFTIWRNKWLKIKQEY